MAPTMTVEVTAAETQASTPSVEEMALKEVAEVMKLKVASTLQVEVAVGIWVPTPVVEVTMLGEAAEEM